MIGPTGCGNYLKVHDDVIKWKHFPRYWPFVRRIHRSPVNSPHKGQWRGALMFLLICVWINGWVNNREAGDLRRYRGHYDVSVMAISEHTLWVKFMITLRRSLSGECHRTPLRINQHGIMQWLGAHRNEAIIGTSVNQNRRSHMASLVDNESIHSEDTRRE